MVSNNSRLGFQRWAFEIEPSKLSSRNWVFVAFWAYRSLWVRGTDLLEPIRRCRVGDPIIVQHLCLHLWDPQPHTLGLYHILYVYKCRILIPYKTNELLGLNTRGLSEAKKRKLWSLTQGLSKVEKQKHKQEAF
jgi:hypothetical protein